MIGKILKAAVFTAVMFILLLSVTAFLLMKGVITEEYLHIIRIAVFAVCGFTAGAAAAFAVPLRGFIAGTAGGALFSILAFITSFLIFKEKTPDLFYAVSLIAGALGGITGANAKK